MQKFSGVWPALVTPSNADNTINENVLRALIDYHIDKGVNGFYVGGTTGEGVFMPAAQRKQLAEVTLKHINGRVPVILHVGAVSTEEAIGLAQHGRDQGIVGFSSIIPPLYNSVESIIRYYERLAASVDLPFLAYLLNPSLDAYALINRLTHIPNLAGTKYTGPNMWEFRRILEVGGEDWIMFSGMDEQAVYAAMMGSCGAIGSTGNIMPGAYMKILAHVAAGEYAEAQKVQEQANEVISAMIDVNFPGALKYLIGKLIGEDLGNPRLPGMPLTDEQKAELERRLAATEFTALAALSADS